MCSTFRTFAEEPVGSGELPPRLVDVRPDSIPPVVHAVHDAVRGHAHGCSCLGQRKGALQTSRMQRRLNRMEMS